MSKARDLANGATALSAVSATELGYVDGVTSAIQTQLNQKPEVVAGKNKVLNSDFSGWSRGTSIALTASSAISYTADRWATQTGSNQASTISRQVTGDTTNLPNIQYCTRFQRNSGQTGTGNLQFTQSFESINSIPLVGKTVVLSFYARAGANYSQASSGLSAYVITGTGTDQQILSGLTGSATPILSTATLTTTWQRFTYTGTIATTATQVGVGFIFTPVGTAGTNDYFEVTGVQLEVGSTATPFTPSGGNPNLETASSGSAGFDGVLVSTNSSSNPSGSGTNGWAGYQVAGKNAVINGGMDIWQRGTSISVSAGTTPYLSDRFQILTRANQAATVSRQATSDTTNLPNIQYCARVQRNSGQTGIQVIYFGQSLENVNSTPFIGKTVTLSFYARKGADLPSTLTSFVSTGTGTDQSFVKDTITGQVEYTQANTLTANWQRFTHTVTIGSSATQIGIYFSYSPTGTASTNEYFEITGVQLEAGSTATPFSRNASTIQGELAACQRYYYRQTSADNSYTTYSLGYAKSTTVSPQLVVLPVSMRVRPTSVDYSTVSLTDGVAAVAVTSLALAGLGSSLNIVFIEATVASGLTQYRPYALYTNNSASAYLGFNSEL